MKNPYKDLPETTKAYLAGLLDGEGCINFYAKNKGGTKYPSVQLKMTCETTIQYYADQVDGVCKRVNRSSSVLPHWKDQYKCELTTQKAAMLCEAILQYLVTKYDIAKELSEHYKIQCGECHAPFWKFGNALYCSDACKKNVKIKQRKGAN